MGLKLVMETLDTSITSSWTVAAGTYVLSLDNISYNITLGAMSAATPTVAAQAISDAINAALLTANGVPIKAAASANFLNIESVENDDVSGPVSINIAGAACATTTNWTATTIESPYVDPYANYVPRSTANANLIGAFAVGAKLDRQVRNLGS